MINEIFSWPLQFDRPLVRLVEYAAVCALMFRVQCKMHGGTPDNAHDRARVIRDLERGSLSARYRIMLRASLNRLDRLLSPHECASGAKPRDAARAWSFGLLNLSLTLALAYPIGSLLVNWGLFNNGTIGGEVMIPEADRLLRRAVMGGLAVMVGMQLLAILAQGRAKMVLALAPLGIAFAFAFAGEFAVAVAVAFAFAFGFAFAGAVGFAGAAAFAAAFAGAFAVAWIGARRNLRTSALTLWVLLGLIAVSLAARNGAGAAPAKGVILFIGALPLINGLADFASSGLTRHLLRKSARRGARWWALADLAGGAAIFFALGCAMIAFIAWMPLIDGSRLADLPRIFADLAAPETRGQYWWLLVMLFSTLLPTILHLHMGIVTVFRHIPGGPRRWLAAEFRKAEISKYAGTRAVWGLAAMNTATWLLPAVLIVEGWISVSPYVIDASIAVFRCFAQTIGAIP